MPEVMDAAHEIIRKLPAGEDCDWLLDQLSLCHGDGTDKIQRGIAPWDARFYDEMPKSRWARLKGKLGPVWPFWME